MQLISSATVGVGGAATIDFTSIPGTYTDLVLVLSARATSTTATITVAFNGSSASFTNIDLNGVAGFAPTSATGTTLVGYASTTSHTASTFGNLSIFIPNYAGSANKNFSVDSVQENNGAAAVNLTLFANRWANTAAITQITLSLANFAQYSSASLYGILKGSGGATVS
jgi:hypothetical protein